MTYILVEELYITQDNRGVLRQNNCRINEHGINDLFPIFWVSDDNFIHVHKPNSIFKYL